MITGPLSCAKRPSQPLETGTFFGATCYPRLREDSAARSCSGSAENGTKLAKPLFFSDVVELFLKGKGIEGRKQAKEDADASIERSEHLAEGTFNLFRCSLHCRWVGYSPNGPSSDVPASVGTLPARLCHKP
jgi:hypothetical protein